MSVSEKQKEYVKRYQSKMDVVTIRPRAGTKHRWQVAADAAGVSLSKYIIAAVETAIDADNTKD